MKTRILFIPVLALFLMSSACQKSNLKNLDSVSYGTSFGMCDGYCQQTLLISNKKVSFSKTRRNPSDTKTCNAPITEAEVNAIKAILNKSKIAALPKTIGCPDCADGGAEWVAIQADGREYKVTFEYGHAPATLKAAVEKLRIIKETFNNCN